MIAIPWYFARQTQMGLFGLFFIVVSILSIFWSPYSGTLIDLYNRKVIFLVINIVSGIGIVGVSILGFYLGGLSGIIVGSVFCLTALNYNIHYPNMYAFVQEITEPAHFGRVTSYLEIQNQTSSVVAGAFAALLLEGAQISFGEFIWIINPWPIHKIFLADGLTYFVSFFLLAKMSYQAIRPRIIERGSLVQRLKIGINYLRDRRDIFMFGLFSYSIFVTVLICTFFLFATYVNNHLETGGHIYALSEITYAVGAIISGFLIRRIFRQVSIPKAIIVMTLMMTVGYAVLFLSKSVVLFILITCILGLTNAGSRILRVIYLFRAIPNEVFGRTMSVFYIAHTIFRIFFLTLFSLAFFTKGQGIIYACLILAIFLLISGLILLYLYSNFDLKKVKDS